MLLLPANLCLQYFGFCLAGSNAGDTLLPQPYVNSDRLSERRPELLVVVARAQAELEQRVARVCFNLGSQHSCRRAPSLAPLSPGFQDQHLASGESQLAGAG